ncbi:energy transducer TonB [Lysobacter enzymogenes]|nr:energy transducer TonB [Lysobacter enzymogenes]
MCSLGAVLAVQRGRGGVVVAGARTAATANAAGRRGDGGTGADAASAACAAQTIAPGSATARATSRRDTTAAAAATAGAARGRCRRRTAAARADARPARARRSGRCRRDLGPDLSAPAATTYAAPQSVSGRRDDAVAQWQNLLLGHLEKFRRYPRQAQRLNQQGVAYVRFAVDRGGAVSQIRIGRSSGYPALDAGTLETVRLAAPVPAPPAQIQGDPVEVMVPVAFFIRGR